MSKRNCTLVDKVISYRACVDNSDTHYIHVCSETEPVSTWMKDGDSKFLPVGMEVEDKQRLKARIIHQ